MVPKAYQISCIMDLCNYRSELADKITCASWKQLTVWGSSSSRMPYLYMHTNTYYVSSIIRRSNWALRGSCRPKICSSGTVRIQLITVDGVLPWRAEPPSVSGIPGHVGIYLFEVIG